MRHKEDIAGVLISSESIRQRLPSILVDSMVVDYQLNIIAMSKNVLDFLEFNCEEVSKKNINYFSGTEDLASQLREELASGYFEERQACLYNKSGRCISVGISGFYLGLISDLNGYILLKIRNLDEVELINKQLQQKKAELDKFIYRTSHDLRGPLATIKGLLNLLKIRKNNDELERLLPLLEAHANKLDERLFQLVYLAQADMITEIPKHVVDFNAIETTLRKTIEQNAFVDFMEFHYSSSLQSLSGLDERMITSFLNNLLMYILSLPMSNLQNQIFFNILHDEKQLKIAIGALGFSLNDDLRKAILQHDFIYTDIINYPQLINFYSAQKITKIRMQNFPTHKSMGIKLTEERLKLINQQQHTAFEIQDLMNKQGPAGTKVIIRVTIS